ncbi:MAG: LCP family protein [Actinomycetales bacterium]|nr:LCP family protein [Actinomycetales bacterium]
MTARHATSREAGVPRHAGRVHRHGLARAIALTTVAVVAFGFAGAATAYTRLQGNIQSADVESLLGTDRPTQVTKTPDPDDPNAGSPVTILVLGSDTREGQGSYAKDDVDGQRSDTTIVVHISADRTRVEMVSIPRDSLVDIPACKRSDGSESRPQYNAMFNSAFSIGGQTGEVSDAAACTQKTVESLTGVYVDDFVVVNMAGFVNMIDALGGVPMCIEEDIASPKAHLDLLTAGYHVLDGTTALGYARARTGTGLNGSDTSRIGRQQELIASVAQTAMAKNLLTDMPALLQFLDAATKSLTISSGMSSIPDLTGLAFSLRNIDRGNITLMTIPWRVAPSDHNRVEWTSEADDIWARMAADEPIVDRPVPSTATASTTGDPGTTPGASSGTAPAATATATPTSTPTPGVDPFTADDISSVCGDG